MIPDEDKMLASKSTCHHQWVDIYSGTGVDRSDPDIQWIYFFCKYCLEMRLMSYDQSMMRLLPELEQERDED